ncbi:MAG: sigma-70 family RNA polymerase sigma factor [Acidimicrobiia bacterium]|nr:sigma-70 family RNA polymerase sigma factor [Acidimicrobiia bacterium]
MGKARVAKSQETMQPRGSDETWVTWVAQIARGDEPVLASLYDASSRLVYGLALRILGDAGAAEEVTLDVYLQVWRQATRFDPARGKVSTWLLAMARSRAIDRLRARPHEVAQGETLEVLAEARSEKPGPEESAAITQQEAQVRRALDALSVEQSSSPISED